MDLGTIREAVLEELEVLKREDPLELLRKRARETNPRLDWRDLRYFAQSFSELDPQRITPALVPVQGEDTARLFRSATSFWSVPVSSGFGRRFRFLVWDQGHSKVMGVLGLCDPVIGLQVRDRFIGWSREQKERRLRHCLTAFVLGTVPPYNILLAGKLVAMAVYTKEVAESFYQRYSQPLVLVDTMGAFGRKMSILNRLKCWTFVGRTKGQSYLHISEKLYRLFAEALKAAGKEEILRAYRFSDGPNHRFRVITRACRVLGLDPDAVLEAPFPRTYYVCPLVEGWREFLLGETNTPTYDLPSFQEVVAYWRARWLLPRWERIQRGEVEVPSPSSGPQISSLGPLFVWRKYSNTPKLEKGLQRAKF